MTAYSPSSLRSNPSQQIVCDHCGLPVPKGLVQQDAERQFCCNGCRTVYEMIHSCGLDRYYRLRESLAAESPRAATTGQGYKSFDGQEFLESHSHAASGGLSVIDLRLEGVHCAACLWLVERLPQLVTGVADAKLNLRSALVRVTWDQRQTPLSKVAQTLDRLGYPPHPARGISAREVHRIEERKQLVRLGVAGALAGNTMLIALALYAGLFTGIDSQFVHMFRWVSAALGVLSLAWPGAVFFRGAWASIRALRPSLDLPIALALGFGGAAGIANVVLNRGDIYFDSLTVLVFLLLVGRWFQTRQQRWADDAVGLMFAFTPAVCRIVRGDQVVEAPIELLEVDQTFEVRSGDLLPADGVVIEGESSVNQALLTGESLPVAVSPGDIVCAGTQNIGGVLRVQATAVGDQTRVGGLMRLVEQGVLQKPPIVQFTDRAAGWFVAAVVLLAAATLAAWSYAVGVMTAIDHTVSLLIVACPCALGLATPLTMAMSLGGAAKRNMLVKDARAIEHLAQQGRLLLDKTGTLTAGRPILQTWCGPQWLRGVISLAESHSQHPIGRALHEGLADGDEPEGKLADVRECGDGGLSAIYDNRPLHIGSPAYLLRRGVNLSPAWQTMIDEQRDTESTIVLVGDDEEVLALAALEDQVREGAAQAVAELKSAGWKPTILSGDAQEVVARVAQLTGVASGAAHGGVTPEDKLRVVRKRGELPCVTVMVGDGVNDAAALAAADVGVAVHGGAEASLTAADVYLAQPGLAPLVELVQHARRTMRVVRRNLVVSIAYNLLAVSLAAAGLITPLVAALLMPLSSATVLASAVIGIRR